MQNMRLSTIDRLRAGCTNLIGNFIQSHGGGFHLTFAHNIFYICRMTVALKHLKNVEVTRKFQKYKLIDLLTKYNCTFKFIQRTIFKRRMLQVNLRSF